jgi:hypothetical protein
MEDKYLDIFQQNDLDFEDAVEEFKSQLKTDIKNGETVKLNQKIEAVLLEIYQQNDDSDLIGVFEVCYDELDGNKFNDLVIYLYNNNLEILNGIVNHSGDYYNLGEIIGDYIVNGNKWKNYTKYEIIELIDNSIELFYNVLNKLDDDDQEEFINRTVKFIHKIETYPIEYLIDNYKVVFQKALLNLRLIDGTTYQEVLESLYQTARNSRGHLQRKIDDFLEMVESEDFIDETDDESDTDGNDVEFVNTELIQKYTDSILMALNKIEIENRKSKYLIDGVKRQKGRIYSDTIKKHIDDIEISSVKYTEPKTVIIPSKEVVLADGTKIWSKEKTKKIGKTRLPLDSETQAKLDVLNDLLEKSKTTGYIELSDFEDVDSQSDDVDSEYLVQLNNLLKKSDIKAYVTQSRYIGSGTQTLTDTDEHYLFQIYASDTDEILQQLPSVRAKQLDRYNKVTSDHQRIRNKLIQIGFIRYEMHNDEICWINTIQSDISIAFDIKDEADDNPNVNELYRTCAILTFRHFLNYIKKKSDIKVIIPTSHTREKMFGSGGFTYSYNELPKLYGFDKTTISDSGIKDIIYNWGDTYGITQKLKGSASVWESSHLDESIKKRPYLNLLLENIKQGFISVSDLSNKEIIRLKNIWNNNETSKWLD